MKKPKKFIVTEVNSITGNKARRQRENKGFDIDTAADMLGITRYSLMNKENGKYSFTPNELCKLRVIYACDFSEILPALWEYEPKIAQPGETKKQRINAKIEALKKQLEALEI